MLSSTTEKQQPKKNRLIINFVKQRRILEKVVSSALSTLLAFSPTVFAPHIFPSYHIAKAGESAKKEKEKEKEKKEVKSAEDRKKIEVKLLEALFHAQKFESSEAQKICGELKNYALEHGTDKEWIKMYSKILFVESVNYFISGEIGKSEETLEKAFSLNPEIPEDIIPYLSPKIKKFAKKKLDEFKRKKQKKKGEKTQEVKIPVSFTADEDGIKVIVDGEYVCSTPCSTLVEAGFHIVCFQNNSKICFERFYSFSQEEKIQLSETKKEKRGTKRYIFIGGGIILIGVLSGLGLLLFSGQDKKKKRNGVVIIRIVD